jgi:hypothetical protein
MNEQIEKIRRAHEFGISAANHKLCINSEWVPVEKVFDTLLTYITDLEKEALVFYDAEGNGHQLETKEQVIEARKAAARVISEQAIKIVDLEKQVAELEEQKRRIRYGVESKILQKNRNETLEEAAKVAEGFSCHTVDAQNNLTTIVDAIRALKQEDKS